MRRLLLSAARGLLAFGPVALAFASGGYFDSPRLLALAVAGVALALVALADGRLPAALPGRLALAALAGLAGWVLLSASWAPAGDLAGDDGERVMLYAVFLAAGAGAWRSRAAAGFVVSVVAAGTFVVIGYGLSARLLPGLITFDDSPAAGGRLALPLTYWNATGALAALGLVLSVRLAGDVARSPAGRAAASAATVPLLLGVYLSFSRGALLAVAAGLLVLLVLAPNWSQLRSVAIAFEAGALAVAAAALAPSVRTLSPEHAQLEGAAVLLTLAAGMAIAGGLTLWATRVEAAGTTRLGRLPLPSWAGTAATVLIIALLVVPVVAADRTGGTSTPGFGAQSARLGSVDSNRYAYWKVAVDAFADHPVIGVGTSGFEAEWLRQRPFAEGARDAHSLPLETLAELGLVGGLLLLLAGGGIVICARRLQARDPALAAGPIAALTAWSVHASLDWDWEMPALTLLALTLAAVVIAQGGEPVEEHEQPDGREQHEPGFEQVA